MAPPSLLLRFRIELSDIDRGKYEALDFRLAQHPSETHPFLLSRVLAYALNYEPGLEFSSGGLSDTEEPCLSERDAVSGAMKRCIEVGQPSSKRVHKDMKAAREVTVYCYRDPQPFLRELKAAEIHRASELKVFAIDPRFLDRLSQYLEKDNRWSIVRSDGVITVTVGDHSETTELVSHSVVEI